MTETIGYWCDECREKYVRHKCHEGLPCGHDKKGAVRVYAKSFGRGGERVELAWASGRAGLYIIERAKKKNTVYLGNARFYHGHRVETDDGQINTVWKWLRQQEGKIIRAFLSRWESRKEPPEWRIVETSQYEGPEEEAEDEPEADM